MRMLAAFPVVIVEMKQGVGHGVPSPSRAGAVESDYLRSQSGAASSGWLLVTELLVQEELD